MRFLSWIPLAILALLPQSHLPMVNICGFKWLTGLPCPFCGLTHGLLFWMHGEWAEAFHWHLLTPMVFILLAGAPFVVQNQGIAQQKRLLQLASGAFACYSVWRWCAIVLNKG